MNTMSTEELGSNYNQIADWWEEELKDSKYGIEYVHRAIERSKNKGKALDVGCGSSGRIMNSILASGYDLTGIDVSSRMIEIAAGKHPGVKFINRDFMQWNSSETFDLIVAWDSIFHAPRDLQKPTVEKLCSHLNQDGVLLFTAGGIDGEVTGEMAGVPSEYSSLQFEYGSLHYIDYLQIIEQSNCSIITMEQDQPRHMLFIVRKNIKG